MTCPDCGYVMTPFEQTCPRCQHLANRPAPPDAVPAAAPPQAAVPPPPPVPAGTPAPQVLRCCTCGNDAIYRVSAVVSGGSWSGSSVGRTSGNSVSASGDWNHFTASTTTYSSGSTHLARLLAPPPRPGFWYRQGMGCLFGIFLLIAVIAGISLYTGALDREWHRPGVVTTTVAGVAAFVFLVLERLPPASRRRQYGQAVAAWERAARRWNDSLYCPRCDHVSIASTAEAAPTPQFHALLYHH